MNFRINNLKISDADFFSSTSQLADKIKMLGVANEKKIYDADFLISKTFEHTLGFLYIQSLSSMLPALILDPKSSDIVLDVCSAPGSKTTLLCELMGNKGLIVANEISLDRVKTLSHNLDKIGSLNSIILNKSGQYLEEYIPYKFDKILLDPPCSALGSFQDDSSARKKKNVERLEHLVEIQQKLLNKADKLLKKNGILVYSTCTTTREENERQIEKFISKNHYQIIDIFTDSNINLENYELEKNSNLAGTLRIDKDDFYSEKFFIAKLKKLGDETENIRETKSNNNQLFDFDDFEIKEILASLSDNYEITHDFWKDFNYYLKLDNLYAINKIDKLFYNVPFQRIGLKIASLDNKIGWRLTTNSIQIFQNLIKKNILEFSNKSDLISYYNGNKVVVQEADNNFSVVKYKNYFLGSGKIRGNTLFSQYPKSRRMNEVNFSFLDI